MLGLSAKLDSRGWLIGVGGIWLATSLARRDYLSAVVVVAGVIATSFSDCVDRRNRPIRWAIVGVGFMVVAAGVYLAINNYQFSDLFHDILKR
jgi:hypothetical protein